MALSVQNMFCTLHPVQLLSGTLSSENDKARWKERVMGITQDLGAFEPQSLLHLMFLEAAGDPWWGLRKASSPAVPPPFCFYCEVSRTFTPSDVGVWFSSRMTSPFSRTSLFWRVLEHGSLVKFNLVITIFSTLFHTGICFLSVYKNLLIFYETCSLWCARNTALDSYLKLFWLIFINNP